MDALGRNKIHSKTHEFCTSITQQNPLFLSQGISKKLQILL